MSGTSFYVDAGYWDDGYTVDELSAPTAPTPVTVQQTIPSYLYWQYNDDSDLKAFVSSYNQMTQLIVNTFNQLNLPVYAGDNLITGKLLDWVAKGLYGIDRPVLSSGQLVSAGSYNTVPYDVVQYDALKSFGNITFIQTTDDIFKRILTWNLYRGDGKIFTTDWLKRRVLRFLTGPNGTDPGISQTYLISVKFTSNNGVTIDLSNFVAAQPSSNIPGVFKSCVNSGAVQLPFQYTWTVAGV